MAITTAKAAPALTPKIPRVSQRVTGDTLHYCTSSRHRCQTMIASSDRGNLTVRIIRCSLESSKDVNAVRILSK
jgi:hypothetical protein